MAVQMPLIAVTQLSALVHGEWRSILSQSLWLGSRSQQEAECIGMRLALQLVADVVRMIVDVAPETACRR